MKRRWKSLAAVMLGICILAGMAVDVWADDGSEKGYTYNYDYWGDISYSPDAYRTIGVYTSVELGLDKSFSSAEGMYVKDNSVYICDT